MAAAAALFNQHMAAGQALAGKVASPMDSSTTGTSGSTDDSSGDSATISANDFLTLLVTEMQNQDPTADTDPNEYIDQLVQVNSLEQLIDINQTLTTDLGAPSSTSDGTPSSQSIAVGPKAAVTARSTPATASQTSILNAASSTPAAGSALQSFAARLAPGNLSTPTARPAAQRVAHALDGRSHRQAIEPR
jgi:flagellar basal-body rod modification protein FlgD